MLLGWWFPELSLDFLLSSRLSTVPMWSFLLQWHRYLSPWAWLLIVKVRFRSRSQQHPLHNYALTIVLCLQLAAAISIRIRSQIQCVGHWEPTAGCWFSLIMWSGLATNTFIPCLALQLRHCTLAMVMRPMSTAAHTDVVRFFTIILC